MMFYLYRFFDNKDRIIYLGKTKQALHIRFSQHAHLPEACYSKVKRIEFLECQTESDMSMKEIFYINKYRAQGFAEFNVADVSSLPQEILVDDENDCWTPYMGSLPASFYNSINYLEGYKTEHKKYVKRYDGTTIKFHQNSIAGKEKYVYPMNLLEVESLFVYFSSKIITAQNRLYAFYHLRNIILLALGVSTPMKGKELIKLKICDVYEDDGKVKPFVFCSRGIDFTYDYPKNLKHLLSIYYSVIQNIFMKSNDYWMFWGQKDDGKSIHIDALAKTLAKAVQELKFEKSISVESLRKTFFRYIFDSSDNKNEALECLDFFIQENYRHTPGRILKYIDVLDHNEEFDPIAYINDKFIIDAISTKCITTVNDAFHQFRDSFE